MFVQSNSNVANNRKNSTQPQTEPQVVRAHRHLPKVAKGCPAKKSRAMDKPTACYAHAQRQRENQRRDRESPKERLVRETERTPQRGRDGQRDKQTNEDRHAETCTFILMPFRRQPKMFYLCQFKFGEVEGRASNNALWSSNSWTECGIGSPVLSGMKYGYTHTVQRPSRKREETIASLSNCRIADTTFFS